MYRQDPSGQSAILEPSPSERIGSDVPEIVSPAAENGGGDHDITGPAGSFEAGYSEIGRQIADSAPGESVLLIGRQAETDLRSRNIGGVGLVYALGSLSGGEVEYDRDAGEVVLPTSSFVLLTRFSLRSAGDFSHLGIHNDPEPFGLRKLLEWQGPLPPAEELLGGKSLADTVGISAGDIDFARAAGESELSSVEAAEAKKNVAELAIGEDEVLRLMDRLIGDSRGGANPYYEHDFSLLRAISGKNPGNS